MSGARAHVAEKHRRTYADWLRVWLRANPQAAGAGGCIPDRDLVLLFTLEYALLSFLMHHWHGVSMCIVPEKTFKTHRDQGGIVLQLV